MEQSATPGADPGTGQLGNIADIVEIAARGGGGGRRLRPGGGRKAGSGRKQRDKDCARASDALNSRATALEDRAMSQFAPLIAGLALFWGGHALPRWGGLRERMVARSSLGVYRGLHALVSLAALGLVVYGYGHYRALGYVPLWEVPRFFNHIAILFLWPAMILLAAAWLPGRIKAGAKHPLLVAVKLWALVHLVLNGDLGSLLLFGSFLAFAVLTRLRLRRLAAQEALPGEGLAPGARNDILAVLSGSLITAALAMGLHETAIGVAIL